MISRFFKKNLQLALQENAHKKRMADAVAFSQKRIALPQGDLTYELQYKRRKTIGIYIRCGQVVVRAPLRVQGEKIEAFLQEKSDWIWKKLAEQDQRKAQQKYILWEDGGHLSYLGRELVLRFNEQSAEVVLRDGDVLEVGCAKRLRSKKQLSVDALVQAWMRQQALSLFQKRCVDFAALMDVCPEQVALTSAKTRWGSANARGCIRLHWRLMQMPQEIIDYVVVHELAHLKEMNHSARFWSLVSRILPDYVQRRAALKRFNLPVWN